MEGKLLSSPQPDKCPKCGDGNYNPHDGCGECGFSGICTA